VVRVLRTIAAVALLTVVAACSAPQSATERAQSAELAQLAPLKTKFPGVLTGFDIRGDTTLVVSVDVQAIIDTMEDSDQQGMRSIVLDTWRDAWRAAHPHEHAKLNVRFIDYRGNKVFEGTIAA
jgi:hypothetical protein